MGCTAHLRENRTGANWGWVGNFYARTKRGGRGVV